MKNIHINDQKTSPDVLTRPSLISYYTLVLLIAWTAIITASLIWNITELRSNTLEYARIQARTSIEKDILYRKWNASHGGVYVPVTEKTPPNPYLPDTIERDIRTSSGKDMTLINPAYMTRQVHEMAQQRSEILGHITSLKPIRPGNAADPWETKAIQSFEQGEKEMSSLQDIKGIEYMRMMLPLITEKPCLKCHAVQGYKEGDIRGGISVSFPMKPFWANAQSQTITLSFAHFLIWLIGLCGIGAGKMYKNRSNLKCIQAEDELKKESHLRNMLLNNIPSMIALVLKKQTREIVACNDLAIQFGAVIGKTCFETIAKAGTSCPFCKAPELWETGEKKELEVENIGKYWRGYWFPFTDDLYVHYIFDITEQKRSENALKESEARYIDLYDNAPDMYISVDARTGRILQCNQTLATELGYTKVEIIGREIFDLYHPDSLEKVKKTLRDFVETGKIHDRELQVRRKDGTVIDISLNSSAVRDEEGRILYSRASWRDITDKKELERQLLHSQKMETVGTLAGGVAHDFNNILTVIIGTVSILKRRFPKEDPLQLYFDQIDKAAESAAALTRNLLTFSRKQKNYPTLMDVSEIIRKQEPFLVRVMGEDIEFRKKLADEELFVMADFNQMEQVFMNLTANARDAMPKGGAFTISTESVIIDDVYRRSHGYGTPGEYALITVSDTGVGIDEYTQARIFEPFFTTKEVDKGTGLGLSLTYGIIKQHSGYIDVRSKFEEGTTFYIYLPLEKNPAKGSDIEKRIESLPHVEVTETILVAEDSAALRNLIAFVLTEAGYKVITAEDGEDALNKFMDNSDSIQLVLLDVIMPKKNGKEVHNEIKKIKRNIKVLFFSGYSEEAIHQRDIIKEGIEIIPKPIKPDVLLRRIRKELDN